MTFLSRWQKRIKGAEEADKKLETGSGFGGFMPFVAIFFGWIPAIFEKDEKKEEVKR